ncbi:MAG TPA: helix-turn-helix transcriptional regulator [Candidatus Saccharimonadales bacterium]|nr:helix-turn-helix transcriptional regulator [Candidatus Saccharimonadales bacterium]
MGKSNNEPYEALGAKIKHFRKQWHQSIGEVSGTLEVDESVLREIESGKMLPSEELLNMLINHFLLTEEQADELRQLASLPKEQAPDSLINGLEEMIMKQIVMYMPADNRMAYTDSMNATVNKHGVTLQFMQQSGPNNQSVTVSQVGMSREHAEKVIEVLSKTLREYDSNQKQKLISDKTNDKK